MPSTPRSAALALVAACLGFGLACEAAAANLIGNGRMEINPNPGAGTVILGTGSNALAPWVVSRGDVEAIGTFYWAGADGGGSLALNGTTAGGVAQTFSTVPGGLYQVTYSLSGDAFSTPAVKHIRVSAAGASVDTTFDTTPCWHWDMAWTRKTWAFQAVANSTTLEFQSLDLGSDTGPAIDSVEVSVVSLVGVGDGSLALALSPLAPNPVSDNARVGWTLPREGRARLSVVDVRGRTVAVLADGVLPAGEHATRWDSTRVAPGIYLLVLEAGGEVRTRRLGVIH